MYSKQQSRSEYIRRINKVIDYLEEHLDEPHCLETVAEVAHFSPFHFHRIFRALTGETLNNYIRRVRLQKAASLLLNDASLSVSDTAMACGFNSTEVFCRSFRQQYGKNATEFREDWGVQLRKIRQRDSNNDQVSGCESRYICDEFINQNRNIMLEKNIQVKELPALNLLYCRHTGAFDQIKTAYDKLFKWAGPRGLLNFPETHTVTVYHDDPKVTDPEKVRQSACITVEGDVPSEGEFGPLRIPGGTYAVGHFDIHVSEFGIIWDAMCNWMSESGYQPAEGFPYEYYYDHEETTSGPRFSLDICIPVKPL
jgi:AraC family transcriptional regulator